MSVVCTDFFKSTEHSLCGYYRFTRTGSYYWCLIFQPCISLILLEHHAEANATGKTHNKESRLAGQAHIDTHAHLYTHTITTPLEMIHNTVFAVKCQEGTRSILKNFNNPKGSEIEAGGEKKKESLI